jgi:dihydroxynaphthoic acid synthetase
MEFKELIYEKKDHIARLTINRPDRLNAQTHNLVDEMTAAFDDAEKDRSIGVIVLTGAGGKAFSAGGDMSDEEAASVEFDIGTTDGMKKLSAAMRNCPQPIIARVDGWAIAGGLLLVCWCDLCIASDRSRFGFGRPRMGSFPAWGGPQLLPLMIGDKRAREMHFLCRRYPAADMERWGLVNKVVPADKLDEEVDKWCQEILDLAPQAIRASKQCLNYMSDLLHPALMGALELHHGLVATPQWKEGTKAFSEKRKTDFRQFLK